MQASQIRYTFHFPDGREEVFDLRFDAETLELTGALREDPPDWTRLGHYRCENCPLDEALHSHCPLALSMVEPVQRLTDVVSHQEVTVEVLAGARRLLVETAAQQGISAMTGLIQATSGCPNTAFFRPMAYFHLPFATESETIYRAASMYLLGQYLRRQKGDESEMGFEGLMEIYRDVEVVNRSMANRLRSICQEDGTVGAVVLLDNFAKILPAAVEDALEELEPLYEAYLNPVARSVSINLRSSDCGHIRILSQTGQSSSLLTTAKGGTPQCSSASQDSRSHS